MTVGIPTAMIGGCLLAFLVLGHAAATERIRPVLMYEDGHYRTVITYPYAPDFDIARISSGATYTIVDIQWAQRAGGVPLSEDTVSGYIGEPIHGRIYRMPYVIIGECIMTDMEVLAVEQLDGPVIGMSTLRHLMPMRATQKYLEVTCPYSLGGHGWMNRSRDLRAVAWHGTRVRVRGGGPRTAIRFQ